LTCAGAAANPPAFSAFWARVISTYGRNFFYQGWIIGTLAEVVAYSIAQVWPWALSAAGSGLLAALLWWLSRRRRKRAPRSHGAKSRALIAALVRKARETARPRGVRAPVPAS
jgi:hypothetical protein